MTPTRKFTQALLSLTMIFSMVLSLVQTQPVAAQAPASTQGPDGDGVKKETNSQTGKVSFVVPAGGRSSVSASAWEGTTAGQPVADPGMVVAKQFAPEFGIEDPERDLAVMETSQQADGRITVRYQQTYQGIPVMGGELMINTNQNGDLYSMNGEVSPDLALDIQPAITAQQAIEFAQQGMAKWHGGQPADYRQKAEPALWIYDEQLVRPSSFPFKRPAELVWRMDMTPVEQGQPVRELVLVSAKRGGVALHFNQIDTAWGGTQAQDPTPTVTPTPLPTEPPVEATPEPAKSEGGSSLRPETGGETAFNGATRYVAPTGTDTGTCTSSGSPCANIQYAINQSSNGDIVKVAEGTYLHPAINVDKNVVILNKGVLLSGGWQSDFASQSGVSTIDGMETGVPTNNGILVTAGSAAAVDRFIVQNSKTTTNSGAIYVGGSSFTLQNSTLKNNTGGRGAGIFMTGSGTLTVINSTISGNTVTDRGAGIYVDSGTVNIQYSTIAHNTATNGGGGTYRSGGTLNVYNSILANNTNPAAPDCNSLSASGYDIIGSTTGCTVAAGTANQLDVDPQIEASLTGTAAVHALVSGSPAIDAGDAAACSTNTGNVDQRGTVRPQRFGCDIGAFEFDDFQAGVPYSVTISGGNNQEKEVEQAYDNPLSVSILDKLGDPVPAGISVTFTAPSSGASGTFTGSGSQTETVTTNASGIAASSVFTANSIAGNFSTNVSVQGIATNVNFSLRNIYVVGAPQNLTVTSGNNQGALPNTAFANPFVVLVKDGYGTALSGIAVTFTAPGSGASGTFTNGTNTETVTTDATGHAASSVFTANGISGTYTVAASVSGIAVPASITTVNIGSRYVKPAADGGVDSGYCSSAAAPCATINYAISQAFAGEVVKVAMGTYFYSTGVEVVLVNKNVTLSGGWNTDFSAQSGFSTIDGEATRRGVTVSSGFTVTIERMTVKNGKASWGAGIGNNGTLILNNSTLSGNAATDRGGALVNFTGTSTLNNSTISGNTAANYGGGLYLSTGTITIKNTVLYWNTATLGNPNCYGTITSGGYNLISSGCTLTPTTSNLVGVDPLLGEFMGYYPLRAGSPAIEAGNPAAPGSGGNACLAADQRGMARPVGASCDIGAYEYAVPGSIASLSIVSGNDQHVGFTLLNPLKVAALDNQGSPVPGVEVTFTAPDSGPSGIFAGSGTRIVTVTTDASGIATTPGYTANALVGPYTVVASAGGVTSVDFSLENVVWFVSSTTGNDSNNCSTPSTPCATIQAAIGKAAVGEAIKVAGGTYTGTGSQVVNITKNVPISGGWDSTFTTQNETTIIDGGGTRTGVSIGTGVVTTLEYLTIQNGRAGYGAGINSSGTLTLDHSVVRSNAATSTSSGGGGLYLANGVTTVINNSVFIENSAVLGQGSAIYTPNWISDGTLTINNSFIGNNLQGGISVQDETLNLNNTTVANNAGNGIDLRYSVMNAQNSTIAYNSGDGLHVYSGSTATLRNSILARNTTRDCSGTLATADHDIIGSSTGCTLTTSTGNLLNVDPKISNAPLGTPGYFTLIGNSPAIDAGNPDTCLATDQRGVARPAGACDIGTFELRSTTNSPDRLTIVSGNPQKAIPGAALPLPLVVHATDSSGDAVSGLTVTFTAPLSGATGTFANGTNTTTAVTNSVGMAASSIFTTNSVIGEYTIPATAGGAAPASFQVANLIWLVSPGGGGACTQPDPHCTTINAAITGASAGDTIWVEKGTYLNDSALITKNLTLEGGWNSGFTAQDGQTIIDGQKLHRGVYVSPGITASMNRFDVRNGKVINDWGGGGILNSGALTFTNGAIYGNSVHHNMPDDNINSGGGIYSNGSLLALTNVTISNNEADSGGGIYVNNLNNGTTTLNNVTITQNFATNIGANAYGGGIENEDASSVTITNTIIAGNAGEIGQDCHNTITSDGNNLIGFNVGCTITPAAGDRIGTQFQMVKANLGDLADNGSYTRTHALLTGSPAIDGGNPATCAARDQRGVLRPQGAACDMGAFEGSETQSTTANVKTYSAGNSTKWPGDFVCDNTNPNCTDGVDATADSAQHYAIGTYAFYLDHFGRKSIDNNNMPVVSTVHYCGMVEGVVTCPYFNAFWSDAQMVYGDGEGFANADDIVAHELTHGVTQYESGLFYFYQSGAISESFSDLWGEYYDQDNLEGNDAPAVKWLLGEDVTGAGAVRSMSNPPAYGDPDKMTSSAYVKTDEDEGGVHSNSGINNKAAYLMVEGGTFNNKTVTALGWPKTAAIYYEAQTNLLTSGSDYSDLYYALQQACRNLDGVNGITSADCVQVTNALDAVQMNSQPVADFNPDASLCPTGTTTAPAATLFQDSFENGTGSSWSITESGRWSVENFYAAAGSKMMYGDDWYNNADSRLNMETNVALPAGSTPFLFFKHAFAFETDPVCNGPCDGGVLEYSKDNGATWIDARPLFSAGANYKGVVSTKWGNSLGGRSAFVGDSHGYVSSRYDLKSLAGQNVRFHWRFATDDSGSYWGWFVDDVRIYQCVSTPAVPTLQAPANNSLTTDRTPYLNWADAAPSIHHYQIQIATDSSFDAKVYDENNLTASEFTVPDELLPDKTYYWHIKSFNVIDGSLGWSAAWSFRTALLPPALVSPTQDEHILTLRPTFNWDDVPNAAGYTIQISRASSFSSPIVGNPVLSTFTPASDLPRGVLWWRVQTRGANGPGAWSEARSYNGINVPPAPALAAPALNLLVTNYMPTFTWSAAVMPAGTTFQKYEIQIDDDPNFAPALVEGESTTTSFTPSANLPANTKLYWRVRTVNTLTDAGAWSAARYFRTAYPAPALTWPDADPVTVLRPAFDWDDVPTATGYTIQISRNNTFTSLVLTGSSTTSTFTPAASLPVNITLYWRVMATGTYGPSAPSEVRSFTSPNPPSIPVLTLPAANALITTTVAITTLKWNVVTLPTGTTFTRYEVQVDDDPAFGSFDFHDETTLTDVSQPTVTTGALAPNTRFYWRVRSVNGDGAMSGWSAVRYFRTAYPAPALTWPGNSDPVTELRPAFDWEDVPTATGYTIQISRNDLFTSLVLTGSSTTSTFTPSASLPVNLKLYWRVMATGAYGPSAASEVRSFNSPNPPSIPVLTLPAANALTTDYTPTLQWNAVTIPSGTTFQKYLIQIDDDPNFNPALVEGESIVANYTPATALAPNTKFYWRVRSVNGDGAMSGWSAVRYFRTAYTQPQLTAPIDLWDATDLRPALDWEDVPTATGYTIQISRNDLFTSLVLTGSSTTSTFTPAASLPVNLKLYWRVMATGAYGPSAASEVRSFNSPNPPSIPVLTLPAANALIPSGAASATATLKWNVVTLPVGTTFDHYQVQVNTDAGFGVGTMVMDDNSLLAASPAQIDTTTLLPNTKYYWRVRAFGKNTAGTVTWSSAWSAARYFRTAYTQPQLTSPDNGDNMEELRPAFDWDDVPNATGYTIQISRNTAFTSLVLTGSSTTSTFTPAASLPVNLTLYWRVMATGTYGPSAPSEVRSFNSPNPPSIPVLTLPAANALVPSGAANATAVLKWNTVTVPVGTTFVRYEVQVDDDPAFGSPDFHDETTLTSITPAPVTTGALAPNTRFYWRVRAFGKNTAVPTITWSSAWSAARYFRTAYTQPVLTSPADVSNATVLRPAFDWDDVPTATGYTIQISRNDLFTSLVLTGSSTTSTFTPAASLPVNLTLYWRVMATGAYGPSAASAVWSFHTPVPPSIPTLSLPAANALITGAGPTFTAALKWTTATVPAGTSFARYEVQVDNDPAFGSPDFHDETTLTSITSTQVNATFLAPNTKFYWRVRSVNTLEESSGWSAVRYFRTALTPPVLTSPANATAVTTLRPTLQWNTVTGAASYTVQASTSSTFATLPVNATVTTSTYTPTVSLSSGYVIFWRVRANGTNGPSDWSTVMLFTTP